MSKTYRGIFENSVLDIEKILESIEENLSEIREITQSISEDDVEGEINTKIGEIEEILDKLLYELR